MDPVPPAEIAVACVPNIGPWGIRRRRRNAVIGLVVAIAASAAMMRVAAAPTWQWLLAPVFGYATVCWFQAREKT